ncbi:MAG TPA: FxLYD domain-containing protein [Casimicrobiaceae bacterium]|nr:FxLYD domain-containing protein [Casimicrobiaceae bacterium]
MKFANAWVAGAAAMLAIGATAAGELKDQMKVEVQTSETHADMQPGTYVCAAGHLHVKATVQNLADVAVGPVKVTGKALDADGKVIGTATATTRKPALAPHETAPVDIEFLGVTGPLIKAVKSEQLTVVSVAPGP